MARRLKYTPPEYKRGFDLYKEIETNKFSKMDNRRAAATASRLIHENCEKTKNYLLPGQMVYFDYLEPKYKEELKHYDANPCTIFFGRLKKKGEYREIGFNLHYYPPQLRFFIVQKIFKIYERTLGKVWETGPKRKLNTLSYNSLHAALKNEKLDYGLKMYIPNLRSNTYLVPPQYYSTAVYTEGIFKKETKKQIMRYWKKKKNK